jgi:hypothetical protein
VLLLSAAAHALLVKLLLLSAASAPIASAFSVSASADSARGARTEFLVLTLLALPLLALALLALLLLALLVGGYSAAPGSSRFFVFFLCPPPEGGVCSSLIKHGFSHSLRQRLRGVTEKWFGRVG